ncbi:MAG: NADPH:quinone oxidoreductase [Rhodocyclales bacterium]|nr:NADPH:quinone oxidoreductase [Rhodocyclales bacterium]
MKAYRITPGAGLQSLERVELKSAPLAAREVRVRIRAVSLNYRDLMIATGSYPLPAGFSPIAASDGAGDVLEVGSAVRDFKVGDRVVTTFFQTWPSGERPANSGHLALGGAIDGVLAEEVVLSQHGLLPIPAHLDYLEAATLPVAAVTAWTSLFVAGRAQPGNTALLLGTGGVSIWALQVAKAAGLRTVITSSSDEKLERARGLGADETINYRTHPAWEQEVLRLTQGEGAHVTVEVGGAGTLARSVAATRAGGTIALVGVLTGVAADFNPFPLLFGAKSLTGILVGSREHQAQLQRLVETKQIRPVIDRVFSFAETPAAYAHLQSGQHFGKLVIAMG